MHSSKTSPEPSPSKPGSNALPPTARPISWPCTPSPNQAGTPPTQQLRRTPSATFGVSNGKTITHNVTGSSSIKNVSDYKTGQWYTIRNVVNLDSGTFDFYIDNMTTPVLTGQPLRTLVDDLDYFSFFINGSNIGNLLVDYFRVNTGTPYDFNDASLSTVGAKTADGEVQLTASADGTSYSGSVDPYTRNVTIKAVPNSAFAKVTINGITSTSSDLVEVPLNEGGAQDDSVIITDVPVVVLAEDEQPEATLSRSHAPTRTNPHT